jgi:hypothetical protein
MPRYQAQANVSVDGRLIRWGAVETLAETPDVADCVRAGLLIPEAPDGSFPQPTPVARGCCGG